MSISAPAATATTLGGVQLAGALGGGTDATDPTIPTGYVTAAMLSAAYALASDLTTETSRAETAENTITTNYEAAVNAEITARETAVSSEASTRASADTGLSNSITTLQGDYSSLSSTVATWNTDLSNETAARISGDSTNATNISTNATAISNETTRAEAAESANATAISNETTRAEAAEATKLTIANNLSEITGANQATARANLGLGSAATQASSAFDAAGSAATVQTNLNNEVTRAEAAEATKLTASNNLSDLANVATARTNLGLGSAATQAATAFDAAGTSAAETTRAEGVEATLAVDTSVVHLAGTETITGAKNFTGGLDINSVAAVATNDSRLSDDRTPLAGSVTDASVSASGLTNASISATAAIAYTKLDATTQTAITEAGTAVQSVNGHAGNIVTLAASDVGALATTVLTTKGDLLAGQGGNASTRLPVGADGDIVVADSTQLTGLRWTPLIVSLTATQQATTYTFALADAGTVVESTDASAVTFTIPPNSSVAFPVGTLIEVFQDGAGQVTIAAGAGVTLNSPGGLVHTATQYATIRLRQRATNNWVLSGDLA